MECNKEEAIRAKQIAENKMQNKDFVGAQKIALKAQKLDPNLENISQMIMVCDVHCSAENKVFGNEKDWYGILKIEPTADEASIKKQYRKFALLLHPDKNKFTGAADAFKLIGEAQRVLLDCQQRTLHDNKCRNSRTVAPNWVPQPVSSNPNVGKPPWAAQNHFKSKGTSQFTSFGAQQQHAQRQPQPTFPNGRQTFWTLCPFCFMRFQFYRNAVNKLLSCPKCKKIFTGHEIGAPATPPVFPQQKEAPTWDAKVGPQVNFGSENRTREASPKAGISEFNHRKGSTAEAGGKSKNSRKLGAVDVKINKEGVVKEFKSSERVNGQKRKQVTESSESCNSGSSSDFEEGVTKQNLGCYGECPRRSARLKQHVSYVENLYDGDKNLMSSVDRGGLLKRAKCSGSFLATEQEAEDPLLKEEAPEMNKTDSYGVNKEKDVIEVKLKESVLYKASLQNGKEETNKANGDIRATKDDHSRSPGANIESSSNSSPNVATDPKVYEYPDPDFSDFDKDRKEGCFAAGQIWAVYDSLDAMPRFYAQIRKVLSRWFKLRITWLEPEPDDEDEIKWVDEGLPASCGKFKLGTSENAEDHPMFSHLVSWEKGSSRDTYKIYPRKGETWALFKNWDIKWHSDLDCKRKYEFEFVEVLSDYAESVGVSVAYLGKLRGFSCLFCRTTKEGIDSCQIPPNQLFRFSHRVPSFQMRGDEREDVPKGSFELDSACLPTNLEEIDVQYLKVEAGNMHANIPSSESPREEVEPATAFKGSTSGCQMNKTPQDLEAFEIPDPEFYDFYSEKLPEKFRVGQVWALYSDEDGLPKYYAQIKKIGPPSKFRLDITWLVASVPPNNAIQWVDKNMPICCGRFRLTEGRSITYIETGTFSHKLKVEHTGEKDEYTIFPRKDEVWALYKNWNARMTCSDLESCEYDIVQILKEKDSEIKVLVLELVNGFKTVFKAQTRQRSPLTMKFSQKELLRFSHQIPAFRLTEERGGSLRGYWELDPAALPVNLLSST
ncbi:DnaJ subfamily B member like [Actinidia chinensis var. chinensis]|uniref:DnaJ subfamily B member like n=1 Tax=Actinidia chinensis var. chinensis TaxID=1590841 RepID=A0A2R6P4F1_ACTCC|nr:DnaJ subfamily B member like [Actinidia chinensis var. chinensis]